MNELEIKDLTKTFILSAKQQKADPDHAKKKVAVSHVSFSLSKGEIYGLLGPNGAGKTTTLRIISSLLSPDSGEVTYLGKNIQSDVSSYRRKIGFLTSELKLDDFFTPDYTFEYMCQLYDMDKASISEKKELLFERFGISKFAHTKIKELSTGMKQKVSLAISLCHDPEIIIFDEPTNGLDIIASRDVERFLSELKKEGKIVLISSHIFSLIEKLCDKVGIIVEGHLIADENLATFVGDKSLEDRFFEVTEGKKL